MIGTATRSRLHPLAHQRVLARCAHVGLFEGALRENALLRDHHTIALEAFL
jgi:hypothetical protein